MTRYEYKFELNVGVDSDDVADRVDEELNKLGDKGWELVAVSLCGKDNRHLGYWFKRALEPK